MYHKQQQLEIAYSKKHLGPCKDSGKEVGSQSESSPDCEVGLLKRVRTPQQLKFFGFLRFVCCLVQFSLILNFF